MIVPVTIYGIKNCDTMKKARSWLDKNGVTYTFHDYKTAGIDRERLEGLKRQAGKFSSIAPERPSKSCPTRTKPVCRKRKPLPS